MSQAYRLTERAEADVEAIADFIAADNIDAAVKVVLALEPLTILTVLHGARDVAQILNEIG